MYKADYHTHSNFSFDAKHSVDKMCMSAIDKNIDEIAITDHFDPSSFDENYFCYDRQGAYHAVMEAKEKYKGKLKVTYGVEIGQLHMYQESVEALLKKYPYEFILGSVHNLADDTDICIVPYNDDNYDNYIKQYLSEIINLLNYGKFHCLAHLDLVKRYAVRYGFDFKISDYQDMPDKILRLAIEKGIGIEINTSGLRQGLNDTLPGIDVIKRYKELGGEIITVGSDAHYAEHVGEGIDVAYNMLRECGYRYYTVFENREAKFINL